MGKMILVDVNDIPIGTGEKMEVHRQGLLHRAFSLFLVNGEEQLLLQRRAKGKYHSGGLWTNSCCSHPAPEVPIEDFVQQRAAEELGIQMDALCHMGSFLYYKDFGNGLHEYELDHVYIGRSQDAVSPDPGEVMDTAWVSVEEAMEDLRLHPEQYTAWYPTAFALALPGLMAP